MTQQDSAGTTPAELMDTDPVSFLRKFDDYLLDLERINVLTLAYRPTPLWLKRALADFPAEQPISALDVGSAGWRHVAAIEEMGMREEFEARSSSTPGWKSPRSAKGDRSPARQRVCVMMRGSVVRPTLDRDGVKEAHRRA